MISILDKLVEAHPEWLRATGKPLSFMKTSTPSSGTKADQGKVLIFVFEEGEKWPTLCVKTTRVYSNGEVIRRNHANLKLLGEGVRNSEHSKMFARPLYLYDDGEVVFCIESVCPGTRFPTSGQDIELVMERYIAWQEYLAETSKKLVQHGDMTPDNVHIFGKNIYLVDYDYTGMVELPGFDIYNFISKAKLSSELERLYYDRYFPRYFGSIGMAVKSYEDLFPAYHTAEVRRKDGQE